MSYQKKFSWRLLLVVLGLFFAGALSAYAVSDPNTPPPYYPQCGDNICSTGEVTTCPADCDVTDPPEYECGDNICSVGEITSCPADCDQTDPPETDWTCGNGICEAGETHNSCSTDCPAPPAGGGDDDDDDDGGGGSWGGSGSSARDLLIKQILERLIAVLQQLIALIIAQRGA